MSSKELMQKYGAKNTRKAIARAIRAELRDGPEILDRCAELYRQAQAAGWQGPIKQACQEARDRRDKYEDLIRYCYGMPPMSLQDVAHAAQFPVGPE